VNPPSVNPPFVRKAVKTKATTKAPTKAAVKAKLHKASEDSSRVVVTVDVGNSHTVIGIFRGEEIVEYWRLTSRAAATADEVFLRVSGLVNRSSVKPTEVTHLGLSTVVPMLERTWVKALDFFFHKPVQVVSDHNCLGLKIAYRNPSLLGADRIANAIAMKTMGLKNGICIDMGSATNFDVLREGMFQGGVIIPGINASMDVLIQKAARLMPVTLDWPEHFIADNTDDALRAGILFGFMGQLEYLLAGIRYEMRLKEHVPVFATGGWSEILMNKSNTIDTYDPYLTLRGIREVAIFGNAT